VTGADLKAVASLVGIDYDPPPLLPPAEMIARWDIALAACARYMRQVPTENLMYASPDRDRPLKQLAYHTMHLPFVFVNAYDERLRESWRGIGAQPPEEMQTGADIADYGEKARAHLQEWWESVGHEDPMDSAIETYWGAHTLHEALERETWHSMQHARQVAMFLENLGIEPDGTLTQADWAGLPIPEHVW
jgi:hypothetical protein